MTRTLKTKFKLENPHLEIEEIRHPEFDAQITADEIALGLERFGPLKFKVIAYRTLQKIIEARGSYTSSTPDFLKQEETGKRLATTAINAVRFVMSSGNIASGIIRMYGIPKT